MIGSLGMSEMGSSPAIIDDSNYSYFAQQVAGPNQPFQGGFESQSVELGFAGPFSRSIIPRREWDDHIRRQEAHRSSPDHWRLSGGVPVLDQNGYGFCWCYGTVGAIMTAYAQMGDAAPHLSAMGPTWQGKRGRNEGGWAGEAIKYIKEFGIPTLDVWPEHSNRVNPRDEAVVRSAAMHNIIGYEELQRNNFDALMSALLDPERPTPVTMGLTWWGHLVYGVKAVRIRSGQYGVKIVNSWKRSWGQDGCSVLAESKAKAYEQIAVTNVKPRVSV